MFDISNLSVSYGQSAVIRDLSFSAGENEVLAIMGRNGMGKTTLFKSLMGVLPARGGSSVRVSIAAFTDASDLDLLAEAVATVAAGR